MKQIIGATFLFILLVIIIRFTGGFIADDFGLMPVSQDHRTLLVFALMPVIMSYIGYIVMETDLFSKKRKG